MSMPTPPFETRAPQKSVTRFILPLLLLVLVVGGLAWVAQNLPRWRETKVPPPPNGNVADKPQLSFFTPPIALWEKAKEPKPEPAKNDKAAKKKPDEEQQYGFKEFEPQMQGHYDFLFKNTSGVDVEIGLKQTSCDCAGVAVCVLPAPDWERCLELQKEKPGETFAFDPEPSWQDLSLDPKKKPFPVKPDEVGIVRAKWTARKSAGQELRLQPAIWVQSAGSPRMDYGFMIPGIMSMPVRVFPSRIPLGILSAGAKATAEFYVWSSTRDTLNVKLGGTAQDPLVVVEGRQLSPEECAKLQAKWRDNKEFMQASKMPTRVLCAYHYTVTVHESKDGQQLPQGAFYRQLPIVLDNIPGNTDLHGPELVGRVDGDIVIGGADDQGRIRFKAFDGNVRTTKEVDLAADGKAILTPFDQNPASLIVAVTLDKKNTTKERSRWKLKVTMPPHTFAGSFSDAHAVTLRIEKDGEPKRLVRIPIEGNVGGR